MTTRIMPPSVLVSGREQIGRALDDLGHALLNRHYLRDKVQEMYGGLSKDLTRDLVEVFDRHLYARERVSVVRVTAKIDLNPMEMLATTGFSLQAGPGALNAVKRPAKAYAKVSFFPLYRYVNEDEAMEEYRLRGLQPVNLYFLSAANAPRLLPNNLTIWERHPGHWCFAEFSRVNKEKIVIVDSCHGRFGAPIWLAGVPIDSNE